MNNLKLNLEVRKKEVYGNTLYYPVCSHAKFICERLMQQKTFTHTNIRDIKASNMFNVIFYSDNAEEI